MITLILFLALQIPADHSPDKTHKTKHEQTTFSCGTLTEMKNGQWRVTKDGISRTFETRADAVKWLKLYCKDTK